MAGTAIMLVFNGGGYASATVVVNSADTVIAVDPNDTPAISFETDNIATVNNAVTITGTVVTLATETGTLTFSGSSTVSNTIGTSLAILKEVNSNGAGGAVTFNGNVHADVININGSNTLNFNGHIESNLNLGAAGGVAVVADNKDINGSVYSLSDGTGVLTLSGSSDISGSVGVDTGNGGKSLAQINVGADGSVVNFAGAVAVEDIVLTGTGTVNFNSTLDVGNDISFDDAATISFNDDVTLNGGIGIIDFSGKDGTLVLNTGVSAFDTDIDNNSGLADMGTVTVFGDLILNGNIGTTNSIKLIRAAADDAETEFAGNVNVATIEVMGTGSVAFSGDVNADNIIYSDSGTLSLTSTSSLVLSGVVDFNDNNGTFSLGENENFTYAIDNTGVAAAGILNLEGGSQTISGEIGGTSALSAINAGVAGSVTTFTNDVNVSNLNITGIGAVSLNQGLTGSVVFSGNGTVTIASGETVTGNVSASTAGLGTLVLGGGVQSFAGTIGASNKISAISSTVAAADIDFLNTVSANTITSSGNGSSINFAEALSVGVLNVTGTTAVTGFDGAVTATTVNVTGSGSTVSFDDTLTATTVSITGANSIVDFNDAVVATTMNLAEDGGTVTFDSTVSSTDINLVGTGTVSFNANITGDINFTGGNAQVNIANGMILTGGITSSVNGTGNVTLLGAGAVSGDIGTENNYINDLNAGVDSKTVAFGGDVYSGTIDIAGNGIVVFNGVTGVDTMNVASTGTLTHVGDVAAGTINFTGAKTVSYTGSLDATNLNLNAAAVLTVGGDADIASVNLNSDGVITFSGDVVNAVIQGGGTVGSGIGTVIFADSATDVTSIGIGAGNVLKALTLSGDSDTVTVTGGNVIAADTTTLGNNTLNITNGTFTIGNGVAQTLAVNLYESNSIGGKVVSSGVAVVGDDTDLVISVDASEYVADGTRYVIVDGVNGGGQISVLNSITGVNSNMISYTQDTTDTDDLVIVASRRTLNSFATTYNSRTVGAILDDVAMAGDSDLDALQLSLQAQGNAGNDDAVASILQSLVSGADGGAMLASLNVGAITQGVNEGRMAALRVGYSDYSNGYYSGATANVIGEGISSPASSSQPSIEIYDNSVDYEYEQDYSGDRYYYDSGISSGAMVNGYSLWSQAYARDGNQDPVSGYSGYDSLTFGVLVGIDTTELFEDTVFGASFGFGQSDIKSRNVNRTKVDIDHYSVNLYSDYDFNDDLFMDTQLSVGWNVLNSRRYNVGGSSSTIADAEYNGMQYMARAVMGYDMWLANGLILTPSLSSTYSYVYNEGYTEEGAGGLGLIVKSAHVSGVSVGSGLNIASKMESMDGESAIKPSLHVGYNYDLMGDRFENVAMFIGGGDRFIIEDTKASRGKANVGFGIDYSNYIYTFSVNYDYEYQQHYQGHSAAAKVAIEF